MICSERRWRVNFPSLFVGNVLLDKDHYQFQPALKNIVDFFEFDFFNFIELAVERYS